MFLTIVTLILFITTTEGTMTCENGWEMRSIYNVIAGWQVRCCPGGYVNPPPDVECVGPGIGYTSTCDLIFPSLTDDEFCECGDMCSGQVIELNSQCSGTCTCGGICCDYGAPCNTSAPTSAPTTKAPTKAPTSAPTTAPTKAPTKAPTNAPTSAPTKSPTESPTSAPTKSPTYSTPTSAPTEQGETGLGLAMGLIFGPLGVVVIVSLIYLLYNPKFRVK